MGPFRNQSVRPESLLVTSFYPSVLMMVLFLRIGVILFVLIPLSLFGVQLEDSNQIQRP